jgi:hypothetical protein
VLKSTALHLLTDDEKGILNLVTGRSTGRASRPAGPEPEFLESLYLFTCPDLTEAIEEGGGPAALASARPP